MSMSMIESLDDKKYMGEDKDDKARSVSTFDVPNEFNFKINEIKLTNGVLVIVNFYHSFIKLSRIIMDESLPPSKEDIKISKCCINKFQSFYITALRRKVNNPCTSRSAPLRLRYK